MNKTDHPAPPPAPAPTQAGPDAYRTALERAGGRVLPMHARLEGCEIIGLIGAGEFSIVYLAYDYALARHVAVKEYMPASLAVRNPNGPLSVPAQADQEIYRVGLSSFLSEAKLLARFDAPSLVKILRFWEGNGTAYIAMPLYDGVTLQQLVDSGRFDANEKRVRVVLEQLLEAIDRLHRAYCFHPDIAPDNMLLLADGRPLLLDFGAARRVIQAHADGPAAALKPGFAPVEDYEEISNLKRGPWTDIYALGAVAYFMISGKTPPPALSRMADDRMTPARQAGADRYSEPFLAALDHALAVMPQQRLQSVADFRRALGMAGSRKPAAGAGAGAGSGDQSTVRWPESQAGHAPQGRAGRGTGFRNAALALVVLALVATAGFWEVRRNDPATAGADAARPSVAVVEKTADLPLPAQKPAPAAVPAAPTTAPATAAAPTPDESRWLVASSLNNASAYENYLADFPNGRHAPAARAALDSLRAGSEPEPALPAADPALQEESLWSAVRKIDKPLAYESFLRKYPNGRYASAARSSLARLRPPAADPRPAFDPPVVDATRRIFSPGTPGGLGAPGSLGGPDVQMPERPVARAPAVPAAPPAMPAPPSATAPAVPDRRIAAIPPAAPSAPSLPQAADTDADLEAAPAPAPPRLGRTLRVANQIMTGNFSPDPVTGLVSGSGRIVWDNGDQFDGTMVRGQKEGRGEFRWANGQRYRGDWSRDQPNGRGSIQFPNGDRYTGEVRNGLPNGTGTLVFANGNRYQGEVRDGQPNGSGVLSFANGNRYRGEVRNGVPQGTGTNRYANGDTYTGTWQRGRSDGQGRYTWANGSYWEGEFRDGVKTANGTMVQVGDTPGGGLPAVAGDAPRGSAAGGKAGYEGAAGAAGR